MAQPTSHTTSPSRLHSRWPEYLALAVYTALLAVIIPRHEPWADEAQAWQLARSLPLSQLFHTYLRYEGSPGLWHLLLSSLIHLGVGYAGMHWVCGAIALAGVSLLVLRAPFPRLFRVTLPFTFFLAYQYAVVARGYVLAPLLLFAIALAWRRSPPLVALLLGLLGNIALHALVISGGLALLYLIEMRRNRIPPRRSLLIAAAVLLVFYGFAVLTAWPPHDIAYARPWGDAAFPQSLILWLAASVYSLAFGLTQPSLLALVFWAGVLWWMERHHRLAYLIPIAVFACLSGYIFSFWHAGLVVPTLIAIFWIIAGSDPGPSALAVSPKLRAALLCFIAIQIGWTADAVAWDYSHPYSPDLATATFLAPHLSAGEPIGLTYLGEPRAAFVSVGLAPYFPKSIFFNHPRPYWWWSTQEQDQTSLDTVLPQHPPLIVVEALGNQSFASLQNSSGPTIKRLESAGYSLTHVFCGEMPQRFGSREEICHLIYESKESKPD